MMTADETLVSKFSRHSLLTSLAMSDDALIVSARRALCVSEFPIKVSKSPQPCFQQDLVSLTHTPSLAVLRTF